MGKIEIGHLMRIVEAARKLVTFGFESSEIYGHGDAQEVKDWQSTQDELYAALDGLPKAETVNVFLVKEYAVDTQNTHIIGVASSLEGAKTMATQHYPFKVTAEWQRVVDGAWVNRYDVSGNIELAIQRLEVDKLA